MKYIDISAIENRARKAQELRPEGDDPCATTDEVLMMSAYIHELEQNAVCGTFEGGCECCPYCTNDE